MTRPSLPGCAAFSVFSSLPVRREREHLVVADVDDDDVALRIERDAVRLTERRALDEDRASPSGVIFQTCQVVASGVWPPAPVCVA